MKYLFGDTTDFPPQRDFLKLLDNFTDTSVKAISIIYLKKSVILDKFDAIKDKGKKLSEMLGVG